MLLEVVSQCYDKIRKQVTFGVVAIQPALLSLTVTIRKDAHPVRKPTMHAYLQIKVKSLAEEARIIRQAEQSILRRHKKWRAKAESRKGVLPPETFFGLKQHRQWDVRREARAAHLAYGFLRGHPYRVMEGPTTRSTPDWKRVETLVTKYGEKDIRDRMQTFSAWKDAA